MKKLRVLVLVSSIEYFDHLLVNNYAGNDFVKCLFFCLSQLKSANTIVTKDAQNVVPQLECISHIYSLPNLELLHTIVCHC